MELSFPCRRLQRRLPYILNKETEARSRKSEENPRQWRGHSQRFSALCLVILLALPPGLGAQEPAPPAKPVPSLPTVRSLKVIPLAGNQELNDLERRVMAPLVVQVLDQNDQPVEGADVVFRFPLEGPSATFPDRKNSYTFRTNADGQAAAVGWMANGKTGTFHVQVTASRGNEQGSATIVMTNVSRIVDQGKRRHKSWWSSPWAKIVVIGGIAGAVTAVVLATHGSGSGGPTITATPGSPTIGGPQ
jgi:hypothetical protein